MDWNIILPAILVASPGLLALLLAWKKSRTEKDKSDADAAQVIVDAAGAIVILKEKQTKEMEAEISDLRERVRLLEVTVQLLETQIKTLGATPVSVVAP